MPVTITFYRLSERKPKNDEHIIYLYNITSFGYDSFEPRECNVEYCWEEIDEEDGLPTGSSICYEDGDEQPENHTLMMLFDGAELDEDTLWIPFDEYMDTLEKE